MSGKYGKKQMNFQCMENKLLEMQKARMKMFFEKNFNDEENTLISWKELQEQLGPERREFDKVIGELEEEKSCGDMCQKNKIIMNIVTQVG